ncbi:MULTISPECIES: chemotaxis protein CheX [Thermosipho]|uniref:Chemotaxis protein CheY n=1 Tax=Thermosipho affectus TaxID=660294 RepID=A0ABX3IJQ9_9BACT|nr:MULTISPECIES: chemotaxis protein CheX [Thermosipho]ANQ53506.1 chemotaxis protein CheY [Thermosipho sp. 1070]APT71956.1 chemotaxis protein CheY [Thermosipho sp. 1063]MBT1247166.1 CheY-P-specific phosphatase CheX [Thermosipho sp. 1244]ONN27529.1 chemotaxis protein CheY [Thermosipho affectus]OOC44893.1 chemotaxis protein CheY [Thermosipho sp. 1074]
MDAKIINSLISAVKSTFKMVLKVEPNVSKPSISKGIEPKYPIVTVIGFNGDIDGNLIYSFNKNTAIKVVSTMMGMPYENLDELALSALGELGNMTSGSIAMELEKVGYKVDITPPTVITGKDIQVTAEGVILKLPLNIFSEGDFEVHMVIRGGGK